MKKLITTLLLSLTVLGASAACRTNDSWTSPDKPKHFVAGAAVGAAGTLYFKEPFKGFLLGSAAGIGLEAFSAATGRGTCTVQDAAVSVLGAAAGAYGTAWIILPNFIGYSSNRNIL